MAFTTRGSLLSAIRRGDDVSWDEFYNTYKTLILLRGGDLRLNQTEKEELVQLVMLDFFKTSKSFQYDKSKGRFRDYLKRVIHNKACDLMRKRQDNTVSIEAEEVCIENLLSETDDHWEQEWRNHVLRQALDDLRCAVSPMTYQVFSMLALKSIPIKKVATTLGISVNGVYVHKHKSLRRLQELVKEADE